MERALERRRGLPEDLLARIAGVARSRLREARSRLEGLARLCHNLAPERLLERGFSLTRNAAGAIVKDPRELALGELIDSQLAGGVARSKVEEIRGKELRPEELRPEELQGEQHEQKEKD